MAAPTVTINEVVNRVTVAPDTSVTVQVVEQPTTVTVTAPGGGGSVDLSGVEADITAVQSSITNIERRVYDVHAYGATGNGTTNDRAAIQAAINAAAVAGGIVSLPARVYLVGTPGLTIPQNQQYPITLQGAMVGGTAQYGTTLIRNGAYPLLSTSATGTSSSDAAGMNHGLSLRNITLDGAGTAATLVRLDRCAGVLSENVRFAYSGRAAVHASQLLNSRFMACMFEASGDLTTATPAVLLDNAGSETNTVEFVGCHWEGNGWTDLHIGGTDPLPSVGVLVSGTGKFERSLGYAVHFEHARYCVVTGCYFYTNSDNACVLYEAEDQNVIVANHFTGQGVPTNPSLVHIAAGGNLTLSSNTFIASTSAHILIDAAVDAPLTIVGNTHRMAGAELPISDARVNPQGVVLSASSSWLVSGEGHVEASINGVDGGQKELKYRTDGVERTYVRVNADPETGGNAGSNFEIGMVADDGTDLGDAIRIMRSTRETQVIGPLAHKGGTIGVMNATPIGRQEVTGSRENNPALASLLSVIAAFGWITDLTTVDASTPTPTNLRPSMLALRLPFRRVLPLPDGTIDATDRATLARRYGGS